MQPLLLIFASDVEHQEASRNTCRGGQVGKTVETETRGRWFDSHPHPNPFASLKNARGPLLSVKKRGKSLDISTKVLVSAVIKKTVRQFTDFSVRVLADMLTLHARYQKICHEKLNKMVVFVFGISKTFSIKSIKTKIAV